MWTFEKQPQSWKEIFHVFLPWNEKVQNVVLPGYFENHLHSDGIDSMNVFVHMFVKM